MKVEVHDRDIIVTDGNFRAVSYKLARHSQLVLRERSRKDDYRLLARASRAACDNARELGWIA